MKSYQKMRKAFSIIEVIFVLVILGIISSIGSSIIVQVYESYITQNALYKVTTKTELVANQLVNRLTYAIPSSLISKVTSNDGSWNLKFRSTIGGDSNESKAIERENWIKLEDIMFGTSDFTTIEWIGYDNDSFSASSSPAWSGIADYSSADINHIDTPSSNLNSANSIISNLSNGKVSLDGTATSPAIFFKEKNNYYSQTKEYTPKCMGLIPPITTTCSFRVNLADVDTLNFLDGKSKIVTERYKLAWSAYAIVPENPIDTDGDGDSDLWELAFYYNYQPWNGENYKEHGIRKLLMKSISVFKFTKNGGVIQFKLCASSQISTTNYISTCKEKVVLR